MQRSLASIPRQVDDSSIQVTSFSIALRCPLSTGYEPLGSRSRAAGWSAATLCNGPSVWTGRALQAESSERQWLVLRFCIRPIGWSRSLLAIMDIRARSVSFSDRPSKAIWATRSRTRRRDPFSILRIQLADLGGVNLLLPSGALGLTEAIPSEPPSLARPDGRATMAEKGGGHPFGEPERAHVIPLLC